MEFPPIPEPTRQKALEKFIRRLELRDTETICWSLLDQALLHPSWTNRSQKPDENNDRLEFLGDSVVRLLVSEFLFEVYAEQNSGELTAVRAVLVSDQTFSEWGEQLDLDQFLVIGSSADDGGRASRLADCFEAVLGALYLSTGNFSLIRPWLLPLVEKMTQEILNDPTRGNYKAALQELTQAKNTELPEYRLVGQTDEGKPIFISEVWFWGQRWGRGEGPSKKKAEQAAAKEAYLAVMQNS
jgi:ribonuclease III